MNVTCRPAASLAPEHFDVETQELLDAMEVELPEFGDIDLDVAHEQLGGLDIYAAIEAIEARENRLAAARDIVTDPAVAALVRERLVDVLLPYAAQLLIARLAASLPVAA